MTSTNRMLYYTCEECMKIYPKNGLHTFCKSEIDLWRENAVDEMITLLHIPKEIIDNHPTVDQLNEKAMADPSLMEKYTKGGDFSDLPGLNSEK